MNDPVVTADYKNANALTVVSDLCAANNIGFKTAFNLADGYLDFALYEGRNTFTVFKDSYKNILEQDYYSQTRNERNMAYVMYQNTLVSVGDNITGLARKEGYFTADTQNGQSAEQQGREWLFNNRKVESFDTVINSESPQFLYKKDWDLGDIVTSENERWNKTIKQNVLEITEYHDKGGVHVSPVFGDIPVREEVK